MLTHARSAAASSSMMWLEHIATRRVDIGFPPDELSGVGQEALEYRGAKARPDEPGGDCSLAVSNLWRFAYDFHSLNSSSICHRKRYRRETRSRENGVVGNESLLSGMCRG